MGAPTLQKYNDPMLAIPHPDPISKPMVVREITNSCSFPAIEYDGSTIISQYDGSFYAKRYNAASGIIWTLAAPTSLVSGADRITPITYMGGYYYGCAINSSTYAAILFRLTSPTTSGATTAVGSQFTLSSQIAGNSAINLSLTLLPTGNFRIRNYGGGAAIYDAIVNSSGTIISTGAVQQNGNTLILQTAGSYYETLDGTIQFGAIDTNGYATIAKNGIAMRVKISWASAQNGTIGLRLHDGYVHITGNTATAGTTYHYGLGAVSIASLDAHLHAICDMMGM